MRTLIPDPLSLYGIAPGTATVGTVFALALMMPCAGFSREPEDRPVRLMPPSSLSTEVMVAADAATATEPKPSRDAGAGAGKSYLRPAAEILGFQFLLNRFDRYYFGGTDYDVTLSTVRHNLDHSWVTDRDSFRINQLGHPYQGSIYYGFARSSGLTYWESLGYTFAGSAVWEIAGETTPPSRNDQIASGVGGTFLGESLFRIASLMLENPNGGSRFWREVSAAAVSPSTGFNRLAFGGRDDPVFSSRGAAYYSRFALGVSTRSTGTQNTSGASAASGRAEALADFSIDYGLPGKPDYTYRRPFDYFAFQATASSENVIENVMTRGLLFGTDYGVGKYYRGVWGLYGSYDYISPQLFRVSSTALSLGTTGQLWLTNSVALQGTALIGVGYAAAGNLRGNTDDRDYHYGVAPQSLLALRLILGEKAALDVTGREYFVTHAADAGRAGHDNITRVDVGFTWRIHKRHALLLKYLWNRRDASFPDLGDRTQERATIGIYYTLLGDNRFGATEWRR
ncbi:MAG TPA: DUF3943 domain-containing protein [Burkholderiales bacterium]|nr:DUF3943 domain-containing protein [Burkholderiales bacterium]